jgi:outer membrane protein OmpA-like peptidoglycan-associated protein
LLGLLGFLFNLFQNFRDDQNRSSEQAQKVIHDTIYLKEGKQVKEFVDSTLIRKTDAILLPNVQFYTNSARLLPYSIRPIQELAEFLESHPDMKAIIQGHTDDVGDDGANLKLSQDRAESVRSVLISLGIAPERVEAIGYGETRPKVRGQNVEARALNRRVEVELRNMESVETKRTEKKARKEK